MINIPKANFHQYDSFMDKTSAHIDLFCFYNSQDMIEVSINDAFLFVAYCMFNVWSL